MKGDIVEEPNGLTEYSDKKPTKKTSNGGSYLDVLRYSDYKDWFALIVGLTFNIINGALIPFNSFIFEGITDVLMDGEAAYQNGTLNMPEFKTGILHYCLMYFLLGCLLFLCSYLANASMYVLCERRLHCIRKMYLKAVLKQDASWFDHQQTGSLTQKMSSGIEKIKDGLGDKMGIIFASIATFISGIAVGFYMCWQLTLLMLITVPLQLGSMYVSGKMLTKASKKEMGAYSQAGALANEVIAGVRTVMSFNAQPFEIKRYEKQLDDAQRLGIRKARVLAAGSAFPLFLMFSIMAFAFWYGSTLVAAGAVNAGAIFGVFWAVLIGTRRLGEAAPHLGALASARLAAKDIFQIIDHKPSIDCTKKSGLKPDRINGKISFENIHFTYPARPDVKILKGVSFEVNPGETIALVGHSGCGKSTSIGLLMRFYDQEKGVIKLDNVPLDQYNIEWLRSTIGIVQQEPIIFVATVAENIRMGDVNITDSDIEEACKMANAHEFINHLSDSYQTLIGAGAVQLSGGQKQRIAIARAIVRKPRLLLLDEATSALDTESERMVQAALDKASEGRTTLCIAHRLSTVRNASKILVFDQGLIVEQGRHEELMELENGIYKSMVKAQEIEKSREDTTLDELFKSITPPAVSRSLSLRSTQSDDSEFEKVDDDETDQLLNETLETQISDPDVESAEIHRAFHRDTVQGDDERIQKHSLEQDSARLRQSMVSVTSQVPDWEIESAREDMIEEGAMEASLLDIFKYARPERRGIITALVFTLIRGFTWPVFSIIYGILFKILSAGGDDMVHKSLLNSLWFLFLAVFSSIATVISGALFGKAGETMSGRLRMDVFKNLMQQDCTYFDNPKHGVGALTARLATDAPNVQAAIDQRLAEVLTGVTSLFCGVAIAFYFGWNMAPIGLLTAAILVVSQTAVAQYLKFRGQKDLDSAVEASRIVTEAISNWRTVQSLTKQEYMYQAFINASKVPHRRNIVRGLWQALSFAIAGSFVVWNFAIAYSFGYWLVSNGWSTPFTIFQVIEALNMASFSVMMAASYFPEYIRARISAGVMFTMIRQKSSIDNRGMFGEKPTIDGNIKLKGVYFAYPNRKRHLVMNGFNMSAKFGETVALVGPSGCGKSTTIQLVERFYDALCGQVIIDESDIRDLSVKHLRESIALVGQEPTLFNLSIKENIAYGLENPSQEEIEKAAKLANIHNFVISLPEGYDTSVGQSGGRLSGGQKQRIAIARAVIRNPRILLLDEATSALDTESEKIVQEALDKARLGRTCIVIAHRLSTIQNADKIIVVKAGKNVEEGTHQTLLARKGLYYRLVEKQSG